MREIKFRSWCKRDEGYFDFFELFQVNSGTLMDIESEEYIQQYTGLKDCKGVEIYEGDIMKETWGTIDDPQTTIVGHVVFGELAISTGSMGHGMGSGTFRAASFYIQGKYMPRELSKRYEIIGNIYENKELL